ncbi:unnamed protein product [Urochloa humidicola]
MAAALATLLLSLMITSGADACADVPLMRWTDACFKACRPPLYELCQETLRHSTDVAELTTYVVFAARLAKSSYDDTVGRAERLIATGSVPGDQRQAYQQCIDRYATARIGMVSVTNELVNCDFANAGTELADAVAAKVDCGRGLSPGTPLVAMNVADRDLTMVVYELGELIVGK